MPAQAAIEIRAVVPIVSRVDGDHALCNAPQCVLEAVGPNGSRPLATGPIDRTFDLKPDERLVLTVRR